MDSYASTKYIFSPQGRSGGLFVVFPKQSRAGRSVRRTFVRLARQLGEPLLAIRGALFSRPGYR